MKTKAPDRSTYANDDVARRKLLVLLAGAATTDDPFAQHNERDFEEACLVLAGRFGCKITWLPNMGVEVVQEMPNKLLQKANSVCRQIVKHPPIEKAVEAIAELLLNAQPDEGNVRKVLRDEIVQICKRECGPVVSQKLWPDWI